MDTQISLEEIIHLLDSGFKPSIIAFEFDLSEQYVLECQRLLDKKRLQVQNQPEEDTSHAKVKNMRKRYKALCTQTVDTSKPKNHPSQLAKINSIFEKLNTLPQNNTYMQYCKQLANAISIQMEQAQTLEELKALNSKLTLKITQFDPVGCGSIRYKLDNKISRLQQLAISQNTMPTEITDIIKTISQDTFDANTALETISNQAQKDIDSRPQTRFALTLEQAKKQILIKIQSSLVDNAGTFPITNPKQAIENLCRLNTNNPETAVGTVVKNLCARQEFETAKQICSHYSAEYKGTSKIQYIRDLTREVSACEITALTVKHLNSDTSKEEDEVFLSYLERELKSNGIKKSAILLRKGNGSTKPITLDDISQSNQNGKDR